MIKSSCSIDSGKKFINVEATQITQSIVRSSLEGSASSAMDAINNLFYDPLRRLATNMMQRFSLAFCNICPIHSFSFQEKWVLLGKLVKSSNKREKV